MGGAAAQPRFGEPARARATPPPSPPAAPSGARLGAPPSHDAQAERCTNFRRELRDARRQERQAGTTTSSDQASLHRQAVLEQMQRAGC